MSVLVLDPKCYSYMHSALKFTAYWTTCDIYYSEAVYHHCKLEDIEEETERLIKSWAYLNELTYNVAYNVAGNSMPEFITFDGARRVNPYQLLKYLSCLHYNIELDTIASKKSYSSGPVANVPALTDQMKTDFQLLDNWITDIKNAIINNLMPYELANWSEPPSETRKVQGYIQHVINENITIQVKQLTPPL